MFKKIMKDEQGLSLVELLAVVVIMAIIAGIGAVAISGVIQKNREDAGVSNLQSLMSSANLYQLSPPEKTGAPGAIKGGAIDGNYRITAKDLVDNGFLTQASFLTDAKNVLFKVDDKGKILIKATAGAFKDAGSKSSKLVEDKNEEEIAGYTRADLW